jgi:hypothetical protein
VVQTLPKLIHSFVNEGEARELATLFYNKGRELTDKSFFKNLGDYHKIESLFILGASTYEDFILPRNVNESTIHLVSFRDIETHEINGFMLYTIGYPWWSTEALCASELAVMAVKEGTGVGRVAAKFLKTLVDCKVVTVVETSTAILDGTPIRNSYHKVGFLEVPSFIYHLLEDNK